jgi:hypothetical protein
MLPVVDGSGVLTGNLVVLYSAMLLPLGLAFLLAGLAGWFFLVGGFVLSLWILFMSLRLRMDRTDRSARKLFFTSLVYLPAFLALLVLDRGPIIDVSSGVFVPARVATHSEERSQTVLHPLPTATEEATVSVDADPSPSSPAQLAALAAPISTR